LVSGISPRHGEERSDVAIQRAVQLDGHAPSGLAMTDNISGYWYKGEVQAINARTREIVT
jgi:hypothetical protein